jgi:formate hydrogenlyase subunit 4
VSGPALAAGALQLLGAALLAPLAFGVVAHLKGRLQGRPGPAPLQPYRELRRLWGKSGVDPRPRTALYRLAPAAVAASLVVAALLIPVAGEAPEWGVGHDALALVIVLGLGRFALALAAWDTGGGFGLMGAARDLTFAVFAEALFVLIVVLAALPAGPSTDLIAMSGAAVGSGAWGEPAHWCAALAFALFALTEAGRQPVDNPDTHLELTMVHEGPLLEYAGRDLALLQWAAAARLWLVLLLGAGLFGPTAGPFGARLAIALATIAALCGAVAICETALAKMQVLRVPLFLGGGMALCLAGLGSWLAGGGL